MMPRRALHLRWNYVEDRLVFFVALLFVLVGVMIATLVLLEDPVRGLLAGAWPILFVGIVWVLTNGASYRHRHPDSLPQDRAADPQPAAPPAGGDPFTEPAPPMSPAELALKTASKKKSTRRKKKTDAA